MRNRRRNNSPQPLPGNMGDTQLEEAIRKAITDEAAAAEYYSRLLEETADDLDCEFIGNARDDELEHLEKFKQLYLNLYGRDAQYKTEPKKYQSRRRSILDSLRDELAAAEFYRNIQLGTGNRLVHDTFFYAMVDEIEHAVMFSTLFNKLD